MKLNIPIAVCLSRIKDLERSGLMAREKKIRSSQGKWVQLYRSQVMKMEDHLDLGPLVRADSEHQYDRGRISAILKEQEVIL
ncbi:MAG: hypothetical protein U9R75_03710 [Candidatus Thermoplasmatota archaeon]|nr:hypothetical protein [Candidatus Thermoplasmatota archaeon]